MTAFDFDRVIRPSSLPSFADCARRQAARSYPALIRYAGYELRELPTSIGAHVGSGVHAAVKVSLETKMQTGGDLGSDKDAHEAAVTEFDRRCTEEGVAWDGTTDNRNTAIRQLRRMSGAYRRTIAPEVEPLIVEERVEADVGDGWVISGQLDTLTASPGALRDLKSGVRRRSNLQQYGTYVLLFGAHRYEAKSIVEDYVARVRLDHEQPPPESHPIPVPEAIAEAWEMIGEVKRAVAEFVRRVGDDKGPPPHTAFRANPASVLCSDRWCPAWGTGFCRAHLGAD